jgi:hypothetical protein
MRNEKVNTVPDGSYVFACSLKLEACSCFLYWLTAYGLKLSAVSACSL